MNRRQFLGIAAASALLPLAGCAGAAAPADGQSTRKSWPFEPAAATIGYPASVELAAVEPADTATTVDEFWQIADALTYNSLEGGPQRQEVRIEQPLADQFDDGMDLLRYALQMGPLSHNFLYDFDIDRYADERVVSITMSFRDDFATVAAEDSQTAPSVGYAFFRNLLQADGSSLAFEDLPLVASGGRGYLAASNSEQLFYAVSNGYVPYVQEGSDAHALLSRAVGILGRIYSAQMSERAQYEAIYQYVVFSNLYDYETLLNDEAQSQRARRVFFLEGSMLDHVVVCDGLTKEIVLLCRLVGIDARHVGARNDSGAHAYVYANVEGTWCLSCPTSGLSRMPLIEGAWQSYHSANYLLTDLDTNMSGWEWRSLAYADVLAQMEAAPAAPNYWADTVVRVDGQDYTLAPASADEALPVLRDARALAKELGMPVEVELLGSNDVLREANQALQAEKDAPLYLSSGTFEGQRLQTFVFGVSRDA